MKKLIYEKTVNIPETEAFHKNPYNKRTYVGNKN